MSFSNCKKYQTRKSKKIPAWLLKFNITDNLRSFVKRITCSLKSWKYKKGAQRDNAETEAETWELHHTDLK